MFFGAVAVDRIAIERILHGENNASGSAATGNFFDDDGVGDVVETGPAFVLWERNAGEAEFSGFGKEVAWKMAGFVEFTSARFDFGFGKFAHRFLQQELFFGELQIHRASLIGDHAALIVA